MHSVSNSTTTATDGTNNNNHVKTTDTKNNWQKNSFSFRACAGMGRDCPSSGGAPPGELAGKMQLPPPPKDKAGPNPAGPDVTDMHIT